MEKGKAQEKSHTEMRDALAVEVDVECNDIQQALVAVDGVLDWPTKGRQLALQLELTEHPVLVHVPAPAQAKQGERQSNGISGSCQCLRKPGKEGVHSDVLSGHLHTFHLHSW